MVPNWWMKFGCNYHNDGLIVGCNYREHTVEILVFVSFSEIFPVRFILNIFYCTIFLCIFRINQYKRVEKEFEHLKLKGIICWLSFRHKAEFKISQDVSHLSLNVHIQVRISSPIGDCGNIFLKYRFLRRSELKFIPVEQPIANKLILSLDRASLW